ncbi:MAG: HAMP domain-containing histidine kinase [Lachnospiraceae bacterium]|nr:HAMP domain-containing histidine kinase [Lachnospiraceae bacterium]
MKKKHFYSAWAKTLTTAVLLIAGGLTGICAGWSLVGLHAGMNVHEIMNPVSYEESQRAERYVRRELMDQLDSFSSENKILNGKVYDGEMTVDISNLNDGVDAENKDQNLEYKLSDLDAFYNSDGYPLLRWLTQTKHEYVYDVYDEGDEVDGDTGAYESSRSSTETTTESTVESTTDTSAAGIPQPVNIETVDVSDWFDDSDGSTGDNRHPEAYDSYQVKCYNNGPDVLYANGIEIEQKFIKNINGVTLAAYAMENNQLNLLSGYYEDLLDAASQVHDLVNQTQDIQKQFDNTNVYVYLVNEDDGSVYTNVPAWSAEQAMSLDQLEEQYLTKDYSAEGKYLYLMVDEAAGKSYASVTFMADEIKGLVSDAMGDGNWRIFAGLDTNYHCRSSQSYYDSMYYAAYQDISSQITFNFGSGEHRINVFVATWVFLAIAIVMSVMIAMQTGRRPQDDEIHPVLMDKFPIELLMIKDIILWVVILVVYMEGVVRIFNNSGYYYSVLPYTLENIMARCTVCGILAAALFAWDVKTYGRRIKERKLGGSIIGGIAHAIKRTVDASRKTIQDSYRAQKANKQLLIAYVVLLGIQTIFMWIICAFGFDYMGGAAFLFFILMILFDIFVYLKMLKSTSGKEAIKDGIQQLAAGNLDYRINTEHMSGENLELAEEINKVRDGVEKAVDAEMKSERLKTDLITNVSHDIKTPLTSIINYVDILKRENIQDERIAGYIEILNRKALRLKQLTEDLVEASKISSGNITLTMQEINLKQLIKQTNGEFEEKFEAKQLDLICDLPEEQMLIMADGRRMFRVIENLYNNAAKYAMPGTRVYVSGSLEGDTVVFSMKNVSENPLNFKADELLERFVRGDVSRSTEGSGLGLEIARNLTVMQGGTFDLYLDGDLFKVTITFKKNVEILR